MVPLVYKQITFTFAGLGWKDAMRRWEKKLDKAVRMEKEVEPPLKTFKAVNENLIILEEYDKVLGDDYWAVWEANDYRQERGSLIDHDKVIEISERLELPEKAKVQDIATMLEYGADIGIEGEGRWPSEGPNNVSVYDYRS